jgi:hypothetical protein
MPYITSVERIGYERGWQEAQRQAESRQRTAILRHLERKIGQVSQEMGDRISSLSLDQLDVLLVDLLNFNSVDDLVQWLEANG